MQKLQKIVNFEFKDIKLYEVAFTHKSFLNECISEFENNERLEFLGDAVIELSVTDFLFKLFSKENEGFMTSIRSALVNKENLAIISKTLGLGRLLRLSKGEEIMGGRNNEYILANTLEAFVGAVYLDRGYKIADNFIKKFISCEATNIIKKGKHVNSKSRFQTFIQEVFKVTPNYIVLNERGLDHQKTYTIGAFCTGVCFGVGQGSNKNDAQQNAALEAITRFGIDR